MAWNVKLTQGKVYDLLVKDFVAAEDDIIADANKQSISFIRFVI